MSGTGTGTGGQSNLPARLPVGTIIQQDYSKIQYIVVEAAPWVPAHSTTVMRLNGEGEWAYKEMVKSNAAIAEYYSIIKGA